VAPDYLDVNIEGSFICCHINNDTACSVCDRISHTSQQNRLSLSRLLFSLSHFQRFVIRNGSGLPGYQLSVVLSRRSSSAAFCRLKDLCRQADLQQLWRSMFRWS